MVNGIYFKNSELCGKIRLENGNSSITLDALIDTSAFKSLVPEKICKDLNLIRIETKKVWGICPTPVNVNIYFAKVYFLDGWVTNSVIGYDILSTKQIALIGQDILSQFDLIITNSKKDCKFKKI